MPSPAPRITEAAESSRSAQYPMRRPALFALWALLAAFTFAALDYPFGNGDEVRHARTLKEMMQTGDYLTMRWQGAVSFTRPATQYWLAAIGASMIDGEAGMRLSSAAASFATLVLCWVIARRSFRRYDVAALAVLLCAGAPTFHDYSRSLMSEPPLVLALMGALLGTLQAQRDRRGLIVAGACLGGAVAIKSLGAGPPAVLLLPWLVVAIKERGDTRSALLGALLGLALALPFYAIGLWLHGEVFIREHFGFNLLDRATGRINVARYPWHFYFGHIWKRDGALTAAFMLAGTLGAAFVAARRRDRALAVVATLSLGDLVVMSLIGTRLPHYILVAYPAAALGAAGVYHHVTSAAVARWSVLTKAIAPLLAVGTLLFNLRMEGGRGFLMQTPAAKVLGSVAARVAGPAERVYAYEWYGQGLSFYAERDLVLLTADPARFAAIDVGHLKRAGAARLVPPPPEPPGSEILVAARKRDLESAPWLEVEKPLAFSRGVFLVRARVRE